MTDRLKSFAVSLFLAVCLPAVGATVFHRETAGTIWQDGLFLGDGATGVMAYAPGHLEWLVNRHDVVDARVFDMKYTPHDEVMACVRTNAGHSVAFLNGDERRSIKGPADGDRLTVSMSAAVLRVRFWGGVGWSMPSLPETDQSLDVQAGEMTETMRSPSLCPQAVSLVERSRDVLAVKVSDAKDPDRTVVVEFGRPDDHRLDLLPFSWKDDGDVVSFEQGLPGVGSFAVALAVKGEVRFLGKNVCVRTRMSELDELFLAVRTSRDAADPRVEAVRAVRSAAEEGFARVREDNRRWWADFWAEGGRATFASDEAVDTRWHYALYALAAQFGRAPMPALNWLTYGPLGGGNPGNGSNCYVHDQNVQIPMLPFFPLNRARFVRPFLETYAAGMAEIRRHTREVFGVDGACLPLNMNPFGFENPTSSYRYTLCGSAYSGLVLAQAWRYSRDEALLREMYPILREFVRFYVATGSYDERGGWHTLWSVPPEIFTDSRDDTATVACLKPCLETAVEAATRFGCDAAECAEWKRILAHYPKISVHPDGGWWCGPDVPSDHYMYGGHLFYPFFPAECDLDRERAERTLRYVRDYAIEMSYETDEPHPVHEWSAFYQGMAKLRLSGGAAGWEVMKAFDAAFGKPNGLFSHNPIIVTDLTPERMAANVARAPRLMRRDPFGKVVEWPRRGPDDLAYSASSKALVPPVLEGAAAFLLLATETLMQSWGGEIRLFPAVPKDFSGSFEGFRAKGGAVVSAAMENGRLISCSVRETDDVVPAVTFDGRRLNPVRVAGCLDYKQENKEVGP